MGLEPNRRYVQIAFNSDVSEVQRILPQIPYDPRIFIEAGTPFIKREGMAGIRLIRRYWRGVIVADLKSSDGAVDEVYMTAINGANAATVMGSAPVETLNHFINACSERKMYSMVDMLGVINPLRKLMPLRVKPDFVIIHKGRDEEGNNQKLIRYKDITKIKSKFDCLISAAGGLEENSVRTAFFNGADLAILNIVSDSDRNNGLSNFANFRILIPKILSELGE
ncbi:orotidine 5'-phosphate decarboxylase / HUMPS family protein [Candidatus Lokiarchaeum ossiferum]|uniref:orotidine 5'-phosphate decarboxylase / HUMPS family protein n=1 Tax=Candidatus Lokiarchaeum ossiferum TaxID=2951803 RepID=UPI00352EE69C